MSRGGGVAKCEHLVVLRARIELRRKKVFIGIRDVLQLADAGVD
jgi:hypothetical protein